MRRTNADAAVADSGRCLSTRPDSAATSHQQPVAQCNQIPGDRPISPLPCVRDDRGIHIAIWTTATALQQPINHIFSTVLPFPTTGSRRHRTGFEHCREIVAIHGGEMRLPPHRMSVRRLRFHCHLLHSEWINRQHPCSPRIFGASLNEKLQMS